MIRFCLLGSGSRGNAILIDSGATKVLIDNGFSFKEAERRAGMVGESLRDIQAVFVTHEHGDHVRGVGTLARRLSVPVYMTSETGAALPQSVGVIPRVERFEAGDAISLDGLTLTSFSVSHDAADPVGFVVEANGARLGIATDLGHAPGLVRTRLAGSQALVLESNHCPEMLRLGPYSPELQQRIRSRHGHLSNDAMNALLGSLIHEGLDLVVLAHISQENNTPERARSWAERVLQGHQTQLVVAGQDAPTPLFVVRGGAPEEIGG
ncbi:MAG TPA: MBL fold metallo-hydrolase [Candidatus Hydrogenedentes bacterium]|nr:MBL fold metallo-hydrolase [Candidatus Hydrogenedentota bacterium]HPG69529.1 MBL fold metallo-hydrolase [Candidatus Hydrogenedentota bacterium]